jgi:hypothetical protein
MARKSVKQGAAPADVGTMWTMTRDGAVARCALLSLPSEWELRVLVDGTPLCSERCMLPKDVFSLAEVWQGRLAGRGWTLVRHRYPLRAAVA